MIIINNNEYRNTEHNVYYGKYNVRQDGKKREGIAPFISFKIDNAYIGIEMIYDIKWI